MFVEIRCTKCLEVENIPQHRIAPDLCSRCYPKYLTKDRDKPHCVFPLAYISCYRIDVNHQKRCPEHAATKCALCERQAAFQCAAGTSFVCGAYLCDRKKCRKKHDKVHGW